MKKLVLSIALVTATVLSVVASNNSVNKVAVATKAAFTEIKGKVVDPTTNEALAGASVVVNGKKVYTDFDGKFKVTELAGKVCQVSVSMISYNSQTFEVQSTEGKELEISLKK